MGPMRHIHRPVAATGRPSAASGGACAYTGNQLQLDAAATGQGAEAMTSDLENKHRERAACELERFSGRWSGNLLARLLLLKGEPGPAERAGGAVLSGADGDAVRKSLERLGFAPDDLLAIDVSRRSGFEPTAADVRRAVLAVDPLVAVALDRAAARLVERAFKLDEELEPGRAVQALGYRLVAVDGFEKLIATDDGKKLAWHQLRAAVRPGEPW